MRQPLLATPYINDVMRQSKFIHGTLEITARFDFNILWFSLALHFLGNFKYMPRGRKLSEINSTS